MACHLKSKSQNLLESADFLHANQRYQVVPHCSYYACFQLLQYICKHTLGLDGKAIIDMIKNTPKRKNTDEGSHGFTINQTLRYIESQSYDDYRDQSVNIFKLKKKRQRADYENVEIVEKDSAEAIDLSKAIILVLDKYC